mmetsp:Transcript_26224/g.67441  ORF Transcript_26224/g.67441 Transcript_26224/m.67441 type:complete len:524 (+) Transcript_26224:188-1759(+)
MISATRKSWALVVLLSSYAGITLSQSVSQAETVAHVAGPAAAWKMFAQGTGATCPWTATPDSDADCAANRQKMAHIMDHIATCDNDLALARTEQSIAHRGAVALAPEHTMLGYQMALDMGAAYVECDVAVSSDDVLVCRHSMCDLHTTTDILKGGHDDLAAKCSQPFQPASGDTPASVKCCTYDFTYAELATLCMTTDESTDPTATEAATYTVGPPSWRSNAFVTKSGACHKIPKHKDVSRWLIDNGAHAIPELKDTASNDTQQYLSSAGKSVEGLADMLMAELMEVGYIQTMSNASSGLGWADPSAPKAVMQTFDREVAKYWKSLPNALPVCYLYENSDVCDPANCGTAEVVTELLEMGVEVIGPPIWDLVQSEGHQMKPTPRATMLTDMKAGLTPWTLERSGCPGGAAGIPDYAGPCGWYYQGLEGVSAHEYADVLLMMYTLFHEVGVNGAFSDFPLTTTVFANCVPELEGVMEADKEVEADTGVFSEIQQSRTSAARSIGTRRLALAVSVVVSMIAYLQL